MPYTDFIGKSPGYYFVYRLGHFVPDIRDKYYRAWRELTKHEEVFCDGYKFYLVSEPPSHIKYWATPRLNLVELS